MLKLLVLGPQFENHSSWVAFAPMKRAPRLQIHSNFLYFLTLQYCIGFAIYQNESATGIHVFPILSPPPSSLPITTPLGRPSAPATSIQYRASNLDWWLISYMILYNVSMPFSQIIPHSPSPTESKRLFYTSVSLSCLVHRVIVTIFLNSIYMH